MWRIHFHCLGWTFHLDIPWNESEGGMYDFLYAIYGTTNVVYDSIIKGDEYDGQHSSRKQRVYRKAVVT